MHPHHLVPEEAASLQWYSPVMCFRLENAEGIGLQARGEDQRKEGFRAVRIAPLTCACYFASAHATASPYLQVNSAWGLPQLR